MKNNYARKIRILLNKIRIFSENNLSFQRNFNLINSIKKSLEELKNVISFRRYKKVLLVCSLFFVQQLNAQQFSPSVGAEGLADKYVDIDGDGDLDIWGFKSYANYSTPDYYGICTYEGGNHRVFYRLNNVVDCESNFSDPVYFTEGYYRAEEVQLTTQDIDSDGDLDIALHIHTGQYGTYMHWQTSHKFVMNTGSNNNPEFGVNQGIDFRGGNSSFGGDFIILPQIIFVDIDDDDDLDYFYENDFTQGLTFSRNIGTPQVPSFESQTITGLNQVTVSDTYQKRIDIIDIDNDLDLDIVTGNLNTMILNENTGSVTNPSFGSPVTNPFNLNIGVLNGSIGQFIDIDNDQDLDFFNSKDSTIYFYQNIGASTPLFSSPTSNPFGLIQTDVNNISTIYINDIENDGDNDFFFSNRFFENSEIHCGVSKISNIVKFDIELFPNPGENYVKILTSSFNPIESIEILNNEGKVIQSMRYTSASIGTEIIISTENIPPGIYFIAIKTPMNEKIEKWIKN
ncbi:MAG: T9SS type A sorting domain-containing protein [Flavobacteriia bacterium]|jgi:hypothetical protein